MYGQTLTIARNTFIEAVRQPIFFVMILICALLQVLNTWGANFSLGMSSTAEVHGDNKLLLDIGLATIFVCAMLLAAFIATAAVSQEIENKTVLTVVSKPVSRTAVVVGKFAGLAGAMLVALGLMVIFLLMGIRHGVMSTASDALDQPVLVFSLLAAVLAFGTALWCNYFYGWYFSQTASLLLLPLMLIAYILVLSISKKWEWQELTHDLKPQVIIACLSTALASLVLTALATAVSTRLGQVMTIMACAGVFLLGLLSNHLLGRHAVSNPLVGIVNEVTARDFDDADRPMEVAGDTISFTLDSLPDRPVGPGTPLYWGANPNGFRLSVRPFEPFAGDLGSEPQWRSRETPGAIVVSAVNGTSITALRVGGDRIVHHLPDRKDFVFTQQTRYNVPILAAWAIIPNMQYFWLIDAVSQNHPVPGQHLVALLVYALLQINGFLALGIALFQRRDVG